MPAKNSEIRLLVRILAIVGAVLIFLAAGTYIFLKLRAPHFLRFSENIGEYRIEIELDSLKEAQFIDGMNGCENLVLCPDNDDFYVSCLDGSICLLSRSSGGDYSIRRKYRPGNQALGLAIGRDHLLYAAIASGLPEEWMERGGGVFRLSRSLDSAERLTGDYQAINGLAADSSGNLYFATSNFKFFSPEGQICRMEYRGDGTYSPPGIFLNDSGISNGLYYDRGQDKIFYSNTLVGVYWFTPENPSLNEVYLKLRFMEACDDLCTDMAGNVWMTDPGYGTVKMFNPGTNRLARFNIRGVGQTSSCRIRNEKGLEMLYITELKKTQKPRKPEFDGRGVLVIPTRSLIRLLEPALIHDH